MALASKISFCFSASFKTSAWSRFSAFFLADNVFLAPAVASLAKPFLIKKFCAYPGDTL